MKRLFIIGNGFDLDHKLHTKYSNFRKFLINMYPEYPINHFSYETPGAGTSLDGSEGYVESEVVSFLVRLISLVSRDNWANFESCLGELPYQDFLTDHENYRDEDGDPDFLWIKRINESKSKDFITPMIQIKSLFKSWISSIQINDIVRKKMDFEKLINHDCVFLSFNYTHTLENIYNLKDVLHIHGQIGDEIIIGHGKNFDSSKQYDPMLNGAVDAIKHIHNSLRKNTNEIIMNNNCFFKDKFRNIDEIYSYGFSFSNVDMPYINEMLRMFDTRNVIWFFNSYNLNEKKRKYKINQIRKCGFKGKFEEYTIKE